MNRARLLNLAGVVIGVAGVAFVSVRIWRDREAIGDAFQSVTPGWLAAGLVSGWLAMGLIGVAWLWIMHTAGDDVDRRRGMAWFFAGQLGKYVPGGIWPIVGQAELAHRGGVTRRAAYSSTAWSMIGTFVGAAVVGATTGLAVDGTARWISVALGAGVAVAAVVIATPATRQMGGRLASRVTRRTVRLPAPPWLGALVGRHLPVWVCFAGMNVFAVAALGVDLDLQLTIQLIAATCLSWMAGFVIIGLPGGLGVRETVFVSIATAPLGSAIALSAAVVSRVLSIVVDFSAAAISTAIARRARPAGADDGRREGADRDGYAAP